MTKQRARQIADERIEVVAIVTLEEARAAVSSSWFAYLRIPENPDELTDSIEDPGADSIVTFEF